MKFLPLTMASLALLAASGLGPRPAGAENQVLRGWISDEGCAPGRARGGVYTGTNPDCAKRCVSEGKKMMFVDPDHKRLLVIVNQEAAKENIGDYVEISGEVDKESKTLQIAALKLIEKGRAMCDLPKKKK